MKKMEDNLKPFRVPEYRLEQVDNEMLLFNPAKTNILYCNETASLVWQLCDGQRSIGQIVTLLVDAYPEAAESIKRDVQAVLKDFQDNGAAILL
jgi:hypothetical protein